MAGLNLYTVTGPSTPPRKLAGCPHLLFPFLVFFSPPHCPTYSNAALPVIRSCPAPILDHACPPLNTRHRRTGRLCPGEEPWGACYSRYWASPCSLWRSLLAAAAGAAVAWKHNPSQLLHSAFVRPWAKNFECFSMSGAGVLCNDRASLVLLLAVSAAFCLVEHSSRLAAPWRSQPPQPGAPRLPCPAEATLLGVQRSISNWPEFSKANNLTGWGTDPSIPPCLWTGVGCDADGRLSSM